MKIFKFICPGCSKEYKITAHSEMAPTGEFTCKCSFKAPLAVVLKWSNEISGEKSKDNEVPHTQVKKQESNNTQQHLATQVAIKQSIVLTSVNEGLVIPLRVGKYTIGRKSSDSTADIKLTSDITMSRVHAEINVSNSGNFTIKPLNAQNPVYLNRKPLVYGISATVSINDIIQLGNSKFVVNKK